MFGHERHPFTLDRFETDGRTVLARVSDEDGDEHLIDLVSRQQVFRAVFMPLIRRLDYDVDQASRWWPLGRDVPVVLDPKIAMGRPTIAGVGVPTSVLADTVESWGDVKKVARWYELEEEHVCAAVKFEARAA